MTLAGGLIELYCGMRAASRLPTGGNRYVVHLPWLRGDAPPR